MNDYTLDDIRSIGQEELALLQRAVDEGDGVSQCKLGIYTLYHAHDAEDLKEAAAFFGKAGAADDALGLLFLGYVHEHALGTVKDYSKAVDSYSRAFGLIHGVRPASGEKKSGGKAEPEAWEKTQEQLVREIAGIISIKSFCQYKSGRFVFPWKKDTQAKLLERLVPLSRDISALGRQVCASVASLDSDSQGLWEFLYQDTLLMPVEVMKALASRSILSDYLDRNGFLALPSDPSFDNALGRCLIDDDDAYDNDYIISGILQFAGHDAAPLWQYRAGLWYEYCDNNLEPATAARWYEKAQSALPEARAALVRVKGSVGYRMAMESSEGSAEACKDLSTRCSKNPQNSVGWLIEGALRGDDSARRRLEQDLISTKGSTSILASQFNSPGITGETEIPFYQQLALESNSDRKTVTDWLKTLKKNHELYLKKLEEEARRKAEEERKRLEAEKEARRKAEEARRKAEEDALRKAEEERKKLEAKLKAEEAARKKKEREEEERRRRLAEEEQKRLEEEARLEKERGKKQGLLADIQTTGEETERLMSDFKDRSDEARRIFGGITKAVDKKIPAVRVVALGLLKKMPVLKDEKALKRLESEASSSKQRYLSFAEDIQNLAKKSRQLLKKNTFKNTEQQLAKALDTLKKNNRSITASKKEAEGVMDTLLSLKKKVDKQTVNVESKPFVPGIIGWAVLLLLAIFIGVRIASHTGDNEKRTGETVQVSERSDNNWKKQYDKVYSPNSNGWFKVRKDKKYGLVDAGGQLILPPECESVEDPYPDRGWIVFTKDNLKGMLDRDGALAIPPICANIYIDKDKPEAFVRIMPGEHYWQVAPEDYGGWPEFIPVDNGYQLKYPNGRDITFSFITE